MTARRAPDGRGGWARLSAGIIHDIDWLDLDTVLVATDFGAGSLTDSG